MNPSIEDIEFLARSNHRDGVLDPLTECPCDEAFDEYTDDHGIVFLMETHVVSHGQGLG